jgi:phosphoglycolate phosphatase-like HAD superfamily hydrolase
VTTILFDIDGTLIRTGRAGSRAMNRAFEELFGISRAFDGTHMAGRTDMWILEDAATRAGVNLTAASRQDFRARYLECLVDALPEPGPLPSMKGVLPGVRSLLDVLTAPPLSDTIFLALLTGNSEDGARLKLEHFDLWRYFRCGAYGDDVHDRNELFDVAMRRVRTCGGSAPHPRDVIVVGDTAFDVACAAAAGARSIAVATGPSDAETLKKSGADVVFADLSDTAAFVRLLP